MDTHLGKHRGEARPALSVLLTFSVCLSVQDYACLSLNGSRAQSVETSIKIKAKKIQYRKTEPFCHVMSLAHVKEIEDF